MRVSEGGAPIHPSAIFGLACVGLRASQLLALLASRKTLIGLPDHRAEQALASSQEFETSWRRL
jgi:hypothetical protein